MRITDKYVFFYRDWPSNFQITSFKYIFGGKEYTFSSTEQGFMFIKAKTFGDEITASKILNSKRPHEAKLLGRQVKNYNEKVWNNMRYETFYKLNLAKYMQDDKLRTLLLNPKFENKKFVEASPGDIIWGVGLDENNSLIEDEINWTGKNLLGKIITEVRDEIKRMFT